MTLVRAIGVLVLAVTGWAAGGAAQVPASGSLAAVIAPSLSSWSFSEAVPSDSFQVRGVSHVSIPLSLTLRLNRVTVDVGGAHTSGRVELEDGRSLTLAGLTDIRVRGVAEIVQDRLLLTAGLNLPTGASRLAGDQVSALGILGGSSLGFSSLALGNGFGVTAGLVYAFGFGPWGIAIGSSWEARNQYTPLDLHIAGVRTPADFDPGDAIRASIGLDRLIGRGRMSVLLAGDFYGENQLTLEPSGLAAQVSQYTPGPQYTGAVFLDLGVSGFRSFRVTLSDRYRSAFTGVDGTEAEGSSGNVMEGVLEVVRGGPRGAGLYLRADARLDSGLEVDNTIATAAMSAAGVSIGLSLVRGTLTVLPFVRAQVGRLDVGTSSTTATGYGAGITLLARP